MFSWSKCSGRKKRPWVSTGRDGKLFDLSVAEEWLDLDGEATLITCIENFAEISGWDKGWSAGFWKAVAELRESPEWNA